MSERDELEKLVERRGGHVKATARDILAAGYRKPRTITTAEELDAVPMGAVVLDDHCDAFQKVATSDDGVFWFGNGIYADTGYITLPATVLHEGTQP